MHLSLKVNVFFFVAFSFKPPQEKTQSLEQTKFTQLFEV